MRIVIFGDSLVRPRPDLNGEDRTTYEQTYAWRLRDQLKPHDVDIFYIDSLDTDDAIFHNERGVAFRNPDVVIYHLGINDCVQRIFGKNSRSIFLNPMFRKLSRDVVLKVVHRFRPQILKVTGKRTIYVPEDRFQNNLAAMIKRVRDFSPGAKFLAIGICDKPARLEARSPGDNDRIAAYNGILEAEVDAFFAPLTLGTAEDITIADGIHLSPDAHAKLAIRLRLMLESYVQERS